MKKTTASSRKKGNYVTEDYLDGNLSNLEERFDKKLFALKRELKEEIVGEINEKNEKYKDEVMTKLDDISGQLENLNEDKVLSFHQTSQLNNKVDNHESRTKRLEKISQVA